MRIQSLNLRTLKRHSLPQVGDGDKDRHGSILIVAGSRDVPGSALLAAHGAMRVGAGKLSIATGESIAVQLGLTMPEAKVVGLREFRDGGLNRSVARDILRLADGVDAIVAGPGLTENTATSRIAAGLLQTELPLALDAATLSSGLPGGEGRKSRQCLPILLPHAGELAKLLDWTREDVESDPVVAGLECAQLYEALVLVKGVESFVITPEGQAWRYSGGSPGLGISGSGDVLAGIVGGLLARGADALSALLWATWLHGEAGAALAKKVGPQGFLAREIPKELPSLITGST